MVISLQFSDTVGWATGREWFNQGHDTALTKVMIVDGNDLTGALHVGYSSSCHHHLHHS